MGSHKLTEADQWFLDEGRVDSATRGRFALGDEVVVCENRHVMLAEFYDGTCHDCGSTKTIPFSKENLKPGTLRSYAGLCPSCGQEISTLLTPQKGKPGSFYGTCPKCAAQLNVDRNFLKARVWKKKAVKGLLLTNKVLLVILGLLVAAAVCTAFFSDKAPEGFARFCKATVQFFKATVWEKTPLLWARLWEHMVPMERWKHILGRNAALWGRLTMVFGSVLSASSLLLGQLKAQNAALVKRHLIFWQQAARQTGNLAGSIVNWIKALGG